MARYITQGLLIISIAAVVLMALALIALRLLGGQLLAVQSNSMQPVFRRNDAVVSMPTQHIQEGTVVSYRNPTGDDMLVSHRVISVNKKLQTIETLGDAQKGKSVSVSTTNVEGGVVAVIPGFGWVLGAIHHPAGLLVLVYVPAVIFLYQEMSRAHQQLSRRQRFTAR